jgi:hypothetical protein
MVVANHDLRSYRAEPHVNAKPPATLSVWLVRIRPATSHTSDASYWDKQLINSTNVVMFVKSLNGGPWILSAGG